MTVNLSHNERAIGRPSTFEDSPQYAAPTNQPNKENSNGYTD